MVRSCTKLRRLHFVDFPPDRHSRYIHGLRLITTPWFHVVRIALLGNLIGLPLLKVPSNRSPSEVGLVSKWDTAEKEAGGAFNSALSAAFTTTDRIHLTQHAIIATR